MSKHPGWHPPESDLFLHLEGELDAGVSKRVGEHLAHCWECRVCFQELQRGIANFIEYRRDAVAHDLPAPHSTIHDLRRCFPVSEPNLSFPQSLFSGIHLRPAPATSMLSILLVLVLLTTYILRPPSLTAGEIFRNVSRASEAPVPASLVRAQRVSLRHGTRTLYRDIVHGPATTSSLSEEQWASVLAGLPVDARDPLNPAMFQRWHEAQQNPQNRISEANGFVTLTTTVPALQASLIVRRADWHTVAERFEQPGVPPVEIREVAFELRKRAPAVTAHAAPVHIAPILIPSVRIEPPVEKDFELAEIRLREILHLTGADRNEVPTVTRAKDRLHLEAVAESEARREELLTAFGTLPEVDVKIVIAGEATSPQSSKPPVKVPPAYATTPPLAKAFWDEMGGMEPANNYLDMLRGSWFRTLSPAHALLRLADRYPESSAKRLAPAAQIHLNALALEYRHEISKELENYLQQTDQPLDAMLQREDLPGAAEPDTPEACPGWQAGASQLLTELQTLQTSMRRLFLVDYADIQLQLSSTALLNDASQARSRLREQLRCFAQPTNGKK